MTQLNILLAQDDFIVGDITGNLDRAKAALQQAQAEKADLLVFPELALTGYPPEDLLLRPGFMRRAAAALGELTAEVEQVDVLIGHPWEEHGQRYNAASWIRSGQVIGRYFKHCLPNYAVFDEQRYFASGSEPLVVECRGVSVGVVICEDCWEVEPGRLAKAAGAELLVSPNASPFRDDKLEARAEMLQARYADLGLPIIYVNCVGGQDELIFDGRSVVMDGQGNILPEGPHCQSALLEVIFDTANGKFVTRNWPEPQHHELAEVYQALVRGTHDYLHKNGFREVVIGLSGGIDSALTLAIAVDALGAENVHAVMLPSRHTSQLSLDLAREQAEWLSVDYRIISIEDSYTALLESLQDSFDGHAVDVTEENLQARIRGNMLMALSNKFGWMLLATGNKSELAVGYCTIYGDMCGGFAPIKDCLKVRVYALAEYRNSLSKAIPEQVITRAPSAELAPDQVDQDSLPPYPLLDQILYRYVDQDWSISRIVEEDGIDEAIVRRIAGMVLRNEYKRRQAAPGVRVTGRAFGRDRRYPITSGWRDSGSKA